jgi:hypothetical protein
MSALVIEQILIFLAGTFFYGVRSYVGKWMVTQVLSGCRWLFRHIGKHARLSDDEWSEFLAERERVRRNSKRHGR